MIEDFEPSLNQQISEFNADWFETNSKRYIVKKFRPNRIVRMG